MEGGFVMTDYFAQKMFYKFLIPSVFSAVGLAFANIVDSFVIGIRIGPAGLAAIGMTLPIYMVYALLYMGMGIGGSIEYSKLLGAGKVKQALTLFNMMMIASLMVSFLFVILGAFFLKQVLFVLGVHPSSGELYRLSGEYTRVLLCSAPVFFVNTPLYFFVRNDGGQRLAGVGFVVGNLLDVVLSFLFVLVWDMGITGAVWSTVIGQSVCILIYLPHLLKKESVLRLAFACPRMAWVFPAFLKGFATSNQYVSQFIFIICANHILIRISGDFGVAILNIILNVVSYLGLLPFQASNDAVQPLSSTFYGEKNMDASRKVFHMALWFGALSSAALLFVLAFLAPSICRVFGITNAGEILVGARAIRIYCMGAEMAGISIILSGYYQTIDRERLSLLIFTLRGALFLVAFTLIFGSFGIRNFWWLFPATELATLIVYPFFRNKKYYRPSSQQVDKERIMSILIQNKNGRPDIPLQDIEAFCKKWGAVFKQQYYVSMTIEELCSAIIDNAFGLDQEVYIQITLVAQMNGDFELHIRDNARSFNPFEMKTKRVSLLDSEDELKKIGIMMVKQKAKDFFYRRYQGFNTLMVKV